jgi:hypothetical protein
MELAAVREGVRAACLRRRVRLVRETLKKKKHKTNLGFRQIADPSIHPTFEEVDFCQDHLVVETFEFREEGND